MIAVITGTSRGIGRATAIALAGRGFELAMLARASQAQEQTEALCRARGVRTRSFPCDIAQADEVERACARVVDAMGAPRVVVNNAAVLERGPRVWETPLEVWDHTLAVNLRGPFLICRALLPSMLEAAKGRIVHVSSISGTIGCPRQAAYGVSKWGLLGLHKALTEELRGTGVHSFAVLPGSVDTDMLAKTPFPPDMPAGDVASVITYAAIDAPASMHGASLEVLGG